MEKAKKIENFVVSLFLFVIYLGGKSVLESNVNKVFIWNSIQRKTTYLNPKS
jgi:hypothetical protein